MEGGKWNRRVCVNGYVTHKLGGRGKTKSQTEEKGKVAGQRCTMRPLTQANSPDGPMQQRKRKSFVPDDGKPSKDPSVMESGEGGSSGGANSRSAFDGWGLLLRNLVWPAFGWVSLHVLYTAFWTSMPKERDRFMCTYYTGPVACRIKRSSVCRITRLAHRISCLRKMQQSGTR